MDVGVCTDACVAWLSSSPPLKPPTPSPASHCRPTTLLPRRDPPQPSAAAPSALPPPPSPPPPCLPTSTRLRSRGRLGLWSSVRRSASPPRLITARLSPQCAAYSWVPAVRGRGVGGWWGRRGSGGSAEAGRETGDKGKQPLSGETPPETITNHSPSPATQQHSLNVYAARAHSLNSTHPRAAPPPRWTPPWCRRGASAS